MAIREINKKTQRTKFKILFKAMRDCSTIALDKLDKESKINLDVIDIRQ